MESGPTRFQVSRSASYTDQWKAAAKTAPWEFLPQPKPRSMHATQIAGELEKLQQEQLEKGMLADAQQSFAPVATPKARHDASESFLHVQGESAPPVFAPSEVRRPRATMPIARDPKRARERSRSREREPQLEAPCPRRPTPSSAPVAVAPVPAPLKATASATGETRYAREKVRDAAEAEARAVTMSFLSAEADRLSNLHVALLLSGVAIAPLPERPTTAPIPEEEYAVVRDQGRPMTNAERQRRHRLRRQAKRKYDREAVLALEAYVERARAIVEGASSNGTRV
eukprot:Amastigsp_a336_1242.p1 type:complete len:285 gc:universal Amastigsp_a336_1242:883-29(-)